MSTKSEITNDILSFKSLTENWDSYGAIPSENKAAANAIDLISNLKPDVLSKVSSVFPTTNGTVSFIWENKDEERVSFEIGSENYSFYSKLNNLKPTFFNGLISDNNWSSILEKEVHKLDNSLSESLQIPSKIDNPERIVHVLRTFLS